MKKIFLTLIILFATATNVFAAKKYYIQYNSPANQSSNQQQNMTMSKNIPDEWMIFQPRKIPFVPFSNINYKKMYETPIDVSKYAGAGRVYNKNYKPYHPEKYLYVTDYSLNNFLKYSKVYRERHEYQMKDDYYWNLYHEYNEWLWNKIRSDFKRTHGMYNATITDFRGIKHKITWEDGGIVSIYEQRKLYYEYAKFQNLKEDEKAYKFVQNFRHPYKDVRVNNPFIEFIQPQDKNVVYMNNGLEISLHSPKHDTSYTFNYDDRYQNQKPNGGVLEYDDCIDDVVNKFMGPDGSLYYYNRIMPGNELSIVRAL